MLHQEHLKKMISNHTRRLQKLREQQALEGSTAHPKLLIDIEDTEAQIEELQTELADLELRQAALSQDMPEAGKPQQKTSKEQMSHKRMPRLAAKGSFANFLVTPSDGWSGVLGLLGVGLIGNLIAALVGFSAGNSPWLIGLWIVSIFLLLGGIYLVRQRSKPRVLVPEDEQPPRYRGLIVLVGTGRPGEDPMTQSAGLAIEYHLAPSEAEAGLETCWLVATAGEHGSLPIAQNLQQACRSHGVQAHIRTVGDAFNLQETYEVIQRIYAEDVPDAGLNEYQVIADFTGGVKPMSAGMILACGDRRPMQYMTGRKTGIASVPKLIRFRPWT